MTPIIIFYMLSAILAGWVIWLVDWRGALQLSVGNLIAHAFMVLCPIVNTMIGAVGVVTLLVNWDFLHKKITINKRRKA